MSVINSAIFLIMERFPDRRGLVKRLFNASASFQTLCEDFRECSEALQYWNHSIKTDAPARRQEYRTLLRELESEIDQLLLDAESLLPIRED